MIFGAIGLYLLAYLFFGLITVALGAKAADSAAAQNLSRPMFAVLLAVFFAALAATRGAGGVLSGLVYAPPFTPFMLLLAPPSPAGQVLALANLAFATSVAAWMAMNAVGLTGASSSGWPPRLSGRAAHARP